MAKLPISHHERVPGHPHRWHVHLHGRSEPVTVELPEDQRRNLDLTDEDIHNLLPTALQRHADEKREGEPRGEEYHDVAWDAPVRLMQTHFMA
jgi:cation transport regulator ChaB